MKGPHKPGKFTSYSLTNPQIFTIDDFLPEVVLKNIIKGIDKADEEWVKASVVGEDGESTDDYRRTNYTKYLGYEKLGSSSAFRDLAAQVLRLHYTQAEPLSIIKYDLGQEYAPHHDCFDLTNMEKHVPEAGQRIFTALLYCTDVLEGGATVFPKLNIEIEPKRNRCLFFSTTHTGTQQSLDCALHGSRPVMRGEKIAINLWFRSNVYDQVEYQKSLEKDEK